MKPFPRLRAYLGPGLAIALFSVILLWGARELADEPDIIHSNETTGTWLAVQAETEYLRFLTVLERYGHGDRAIDQEELRQRFEILWSRLPLLLGGGESVYLRSMPATVATIEALRAELAAIEPKVPAIPVKSRRRIGMSLNA